MEHYFPLRYQLTHRFSVANPQFLRCMGQLLYPASYPEAVEERGFRLKPGLRTALDTSNARRVVFRMVPLASKNMQSGIANGEKLFVVPPSGGM